MRKAFSYFSINKSKLSILVKKGDLPSLPVKLEVESIPLSKRRNVQGYFAYTLIPKEYEDCEWRDILTIEKFADIDGAIVCEGLGELFPLFNDIDLLIPNLFLKASFNSTEATFFGGSFNPWHEGHTECLKRCDSNNIIIVPDRNPWKEEIELECFFQSFMKLARRFKDTPYSVYPGFYGLERTNPTVDWLPRTNFKKKSLLLGDDNFCSFFKWKDSEILISNLSKIYVLNRNHSLEEIESTKHNLLKVKNDLEVSILGEHEYMSLRSTDLRAQK